MTQNLTIADTRRKASLRSNSRRGALRTPARQAASIISFFFGFALLIVLLAQEARAESDEGEHAIDYCMYFSSSIKSNDKHAALCEIRNAIDYCRHFPSTIRWSDDGSVLCF